MAPRPKNRGIFGRLDELREQAVGIRDSMRALEEENAELRKILKQVGNEKWGTRDEQMYDPKQLGRGIVVEHEHTGSGAIAAEIAMDHLDEFPDYYDWHEWMERMLRAGLFVAGIREHLAALEHVQWIAWSQSIAKSESLSPERIRRWEKLWVPYDQLSEEDKDHDRKWADKVLKIMGLI